MQDKEFLKGYEIRNLDLGPRMYKFFAIAAVLNLLLVFVVGQTNMLARSACESPFVNRVCTVLDTVYLSSKILSTDAGYVVKDYESTKIQSSDVVWVDQTNAEPALQYPTGYFQIANRDELAMLQASPDGVQPTPTPVPILPPILPPSPKADDLMTRKPVLPKRRDNVVVGDLPDDPLADTDDDTVANANTSVNTNTTTGNKPSDDLVAVNTNTNTNTKPAAKPSPGNTDEDGYPVPTINKQPLYDFVDGVVEKVNARKVDLRGQFKVVMDAYINEDGRLDAEKSRWLTTEEEGDPQMILVAKDAVEKVGDSGWLLYLSDQGIKNVRVVFFQNDEELGTNIIAVMPSQNNARIVASGFKTLISGALLAHNSGAKVLEDDVLLLLNSAEITNEKNLLKIDFNLQKDEAQQIINTRLEEYQAEKARKKMETPSPTQPNSQFEKAVTVDSAGL